jgi:hypothetical protein
MINEDKNEEMKNCSKWITKEGRSTPEYITKERD